MGMKYHYDHFTKAQEIRLIAQAYMVREWRAGIRTMLSTCSLNHYATLPPEDRETQTSFPHNPLLHSKLK